MSPAGQKDAVPRALQAWRQVPGSLATTAEKSGGDYCQKSGGRLLEAAGARKIEADFPFRLLRTSGSQRQSSRCWPSSYSRGSFGEIRRTLVGKAKPPTKEWALDICVYHTMGGLFVVFRPGFV